MIKNILILCICLNIFSTGFVQTQTRILNNTELLTIIKKGVDKTYNFEFVEAKEIFTEIQGQTPGHPVSQLLFGIFKYYKYYPLTPTHPKTDEFINHLTNCMSLADSMLENDSNDLEGVLFDLVARSLLSMYYADNGLSMKVMSLAPQVYRFVVKGFDLMDEFEEFYFTTGLYNYYREAYADAHPVYKPILVFFQRGDRKLGLEQLIYASENAYFIRAEALLFLSFIYLNYENNPPMSVYYAHKLHSLYPKNSYFMSQYTEALLINKQYEEARPYVYNLLTNSKQNDFMIMKGFVFKGIFEEKFRNNYENAIKDYNNGLKIADKFGSMANNYKAYAYLGLARIYESRGDSRKARENRRLGRSLAKYDYYFDMD